MKKYSLIVFSILGICLASTGCDSGADSVQVQDIVELKWQSNGSAIFGFMQTYVETATSAIPNTAYSMVRFNPDGAVNQIFKTDPLLRFSDPSTGEAEAFSPSLFVSQDGSTIVTQLEGDLYRYHTQTGALEKLIQQFHLMIVSPDLHYAVGTTSPAIQPTKTVFIYDITTTPIHKVAQFDVAILQDPGIWLSNGMFGITCKDTIGSHISIFDTTGTLEQTIGGAEIVFHNAIYNSQTNDLYFRNRATATTDLTVDKVNLTTMVRTNVIKDSVNNFDVTRDESTIIYSKYNGGGLALSRNIQTGNVLQIATDIRLIIALSPAEDKIAYIGQRDANFSEIHVIPFTRP